MFTPIFFSTNFFCPKNVDPPKLLPQIDVYSAKILNSGWSDIQSLIMLRLSSIEENVNISKFSILVWSSKLEFEKDPNVWSSSIRDHLHYEQFVQF